MKQDTDLFQQLHQGQSKMNPLADRMRPKSLAEFVGQEHILGQGKVLRKAIESGEVSSMMLWGPPGTGKTTLAYLIASYTGADFVSFSAVTSGVKEIRQVIERAKYQREVYQRKTILFVDEIHRFNKAQQDAFLPFVEDGTIILVGATTENPYFEVTGPLLSRSRVFQLRPLTEEQILTLLHRALEDPERGYGRRSIDVAEKALAHLAHLAGGDARTALNALELAVESSSPDDADNVIHIDLSVAQESIQRRAILYDKDGDVHYDTISAFIKSVRGSDPDAALHWLAKMIYAGEDPKFIMRRLLILASEDIGLADPMAIVVASGCARALEWVGLPEAQYHLAEATIYLATAPKSNSVGAYFKALAEVEKEGMVEVPDHLKDASRDGKALGHQQDYKYPHDYPGHHVAQQYLPSELQGRRYYKPSDQGYEKVVAERLARWRKDRSQHDQEK